MNSLIVYGTRYGCTEKCARLLATNLAGQVDLCNLKMVKSINLSKYDRVIIGGSIYIGKIQKEVTKFCLDHRSELSQKPIGLFICGMSEKEVAEAELAAAFPDELATHATVKGFFGGEFNLAKMKPLDKFIVKKVAKVDQDSSNILGENITRFAQQMNEAGNK